MKSKCSCDGFIKFGGKFSHECGGRHFAKASTCVFKGPHMPLMIAGEVHMGKFVSAATLVRWHRHDVITSFLTKYLFHPKGLAKRSLLLIPQL